jgi:hypothetical protein
MEGALGQQKSANCRSRLFLQFHMSLLLRIITIMIMTAAASCRRPERSLDPVRSEMWRARRRLATAAALAIAASMTTCGGGGTAGSDAATDDRPLSAEGALGEKIFADASPSASGRQSCASWHDPAHAHSPANTSEGPYNRRPGDAPALSDGEIDDVIAFLRTLSDGYVP